MPKFQIPQNPGAVPRPYPDFRDIPLGSFLSPVVLPSEYSVFQEFGSVPVKNQNNSLSCTGHAWSYYAEVLELIETKTYIRKSPRFIYCQTYLPNGGAYIEAGAGIIKNEGIADNLVFFAPDSPTEAEVRDKTEIEQSFTNALIYKASGYAFIAPTDIPTTKQAIYQNKGVVTGVYGTNEGWQIAMVKPPLPTETAWGHAIYLCGWKIINGIEYIQFINSWGEGWGDKGFGYLPVEYFINKYIFTLVSLADLPDNWQSLIQMNKIIGDKRDNRQYVLESSTTNILHWIFGQPGQDSELLKELSAAGVVDPSKIEWHDNLDGFVIGSPWAVLR